MIPNTCFFQFKSLLNIFKQILNETFSSFEISYITAKEYNFRPLLTFKYHPRLHKTTIQQMTLLSDYPWRCDNYVTLWSRHNHQLHSKATIFFIFFPLLPLSSLLLVLLILVFCLLSDYLPLPLACLLFSGVRSTGGILNSQFHLRAKHLNWYDFEIFKIWWWW